MIENKMGNISDFNIFMVFESNN